MVFIIFLKLLAPAVKMSFSGKMCGDSTTSGKYNESEN